MAGGDGAGPGQAPAAWAAIIAITHQDGAALTSALPAGTSSCPGWTSAAAAGWRCRRSRPRTGPAGNSRAAGSSVRRWVVPTADALPCLLVAGWFCSSVTPVLFFWVLRHVSQTRPPAALSGCRPRLLTGRSGSGGDPRPVLPVLAATRCLCPPAATVWFILDIRLCAAGGSAASRQDSACRCLLVGFG